jgi:hypothetical protein
VQAPPSSPRDRLASTSLLALLGVVLAAALFREDRAIQRAIPFAVPAAVLAAYAAERYLLRSWGAYAMVIAAALLQFVTWWALAPR